MDEVQVELPEQQVLAPGASTTKFWLAQVVPILEEYVNIVNHSFFLPKCIIDATISSMYTQNHMQ